ncbi:glycosyltransferase family 2 protein [uncultured Flavobacterium sp.]|uniref:glycosyltransferase family 2 protein n=1 Tax=uncultured Flavobacterium sp. TaxID=165435 RepID=UPI0030EC47F3|tara:strand:+ start:78816 stop:79784 length:969 start_codon:yes stop_codon:yes gene_type:complete
MISVALCTYNGENFLTKQLDSILNQTITVDEIVICDDISTDSTIKIIEDYQIKYPNLITLYKNEVNLKSNKNFEKAIQLCSGDFIFLSDQDDLWRKDKVEKTLEVFTNNPTAEGVFSNASLIDDNDKILFENISLWDSVYFFESKIIKPLDLHRLLLLKGNYLTGATLCIKKEVKDFCFPFQTLEKIFLHDEWFAYILSERKTLFYSTENLISYRIHSNQQMGVGNIVKNAEKIKKSPKNMQIILGILKPKSFRDYKILTRTLFSQYEKYKELKMDTFLDSEKIEKKLLDYYFEADKQMKKVNPILYFFRKRKDKKKGKRQI